MTVESSRSFLGRAVVTIAGCAFLASGGYAQESRSEVPPVLEAATYLDAEVLKGDHHTVRDAVVSDGYMATCTVDSAFGEFEAYGESLLAIRLREIGAPAELDELSKTKVFADALAKGALAQIETGTDRPETNVTWRRANANPTN